MSTALAEAGFDEEEFVKRGGIYDWELKGSTDIEDLGRESSQMHPSKAQKPGLNAKATGKTQAALPNGKPESPEFGFDWYGRVKLVASWACLWIFGPLGNAPPQALRTRLLSLGAMEDMYRALGTG